MTPVNVLSEPPLAVSEGHRPANSRPADPTREYEPGWREPRPRPGTPPLPPTAASAARVPAAARPPRAPAPLIPACHGHQQGGPGHRAREPTSQAASTIANLDKLPLSKCKDLTDRFI